MTCKNLLVDNGSRSANAVLNLRRLARLLSEETGKNITAVPLQHANKIPAESLDGETALILKEVIEEALSHGIREFTILPLFFGYSRAVGKLIPDTLNALKETHDDFNYHICDVLCPLPQGEPLLTTLLLENLQSLPLNTIDTIILVDHGSPSKQVAAVREKLAEQLITQLPQSIVLLQAAMERREGKQYDFTGTLLSQQLEVIASKGINTTVAISMLFISPGRHAGAEGDIEKICAQAMQQFPHLNIHISPLVGDSPLLIGLLAQRLATA